MTSKKKQQVELKPTSTSTCSVCNKSVYNPDNGDVSAAVTGVVGSNPFDPPSQEAYLHLQMGPYKLNKLYIVCWECWFKAHGVKP